jgi:hypothetical protein
MKIHLPILFQKKIRGSRSNLIYRFCLGQLEHFQKIFFHNPVKMLVVQVWIILVFINFIYKSVEVDLKKNLKYALRCSVHLGMRHPKAPQTPANYFIYLSKLSCNSTAPPEPCRG